MDSDDAVLDYAFYELYKIAVEFQADVVHCDNCYHAPNETVTTDKNFLKERIRVHDTPQQPELFPDDFGALIKRFTEFKIMWEPWNHLIKRDLILTNDLKFPNLTIAYDLLFSFFVFCVTKRCVRIPKSFYVWRIRQNSNSRESLSLEKTIKRKGGDVIRGITLIDDFISKIDFFINNPEYKYAVCDFFIRAGGINELLALYTKTPVAQIDELFRPELANIKNLTPFTSFIFNRMNVFNINLIQQQNLIRQQQQIIQQLQAQIQQLQQNQPPTFRLQL